MESSGVPPCCPTPASAFFCVCVVIWLSEIIWVMLVSSLFPLPQQQKILEKIRGLSLEWRVLYTKWLWCFSLGQGSKGGLTSWRREWSMEDDNSCCKTADGLLSFVCLQVTCIFININIFINIFINKHISFVLTYT